MHQLSVCLLLKRILAESCSFDGCYDCNLDIVNILQILYAASQHCLNQEMDNTFLSNLEHDRMPEMKPHHLKKKIDQLLDMVTAKKSLQGTQMSYPFFINTFTINLLCGSWCTETPSESAVAHWLYQGSRQLLEKSYGHVEVYSGKLHPPHLQ